MDKERVNKGIEVYFSDLHKDAQEATLDLLRIKSPEELNLDIVPLFTLEMEDGGADYA